MYGSMILIPTVLKKNLQGGGQKFSGGGECILNPPSLLQDVAFSDPKNERALGQLVVLLQYSWPREEAMFASVITTIQKRRKFNFPEFFKYIISILSSQRRRGLVSFPGLNCWSQSQVNWSHSQGSIDLASNPGAHPAFCRLQYEKLQATKSRMRARVRGYN